MAQNGRDIWAKAHAKWSVWVENQKCQRGAKKNCTTPLELLCAKKPLQKTPNIRKIRAF